MTITHTVEIPANRRITLEVPKEIPEGRAVLTFTLEPENAATHECPICAKHRDPVTGELRLNAEMIAGMQEVEDMIAGKKPAKWFNSLDEMLEDLDKDDA